MGLRVARDSRRTAPSVQPRASTGEGRRGELEWDWLAWRGVYGMSVV